MSNVRRWYIYVVSAISLQAVAWAIIALLRNLFIFGIDPLAVAFQIAVIIIGLPVFLAHWLWGQRLVAKALDERGATLRRFYLYGSMAGFLAPFLTNAFDLIRKFLGGINELQSYEYKHLSVGETVVYHLTALIVLAVLWFYHYKVALDDADDVPGSGGPATVRRLYVLGFSAAGLTMTTLTIIHLIRWLMLEFGTSVIRNSGLSVEIADEITRLIIGVPLWVIFWRWAQRLFNDPSDEERNSVLRKFYLYGAILVGALGTVVNATAILAAIFRRLLNLPSSGDLRQPLPIIIGLGVLWFFHALVIRDDAKQSDEAPRQSGVRRLYTYLIAAVGFAALLVGLSGDIIIVLELMDSNFGDGLRNQFAWYTAAIIAGLPVWIIPWRQAQTIATVAGSVGADARRSIVRKIYLYFFLFLATMTALSSTVYIVFRVLSMLLGEDPPSLEELGQAISFGLIAAGVWFYHNSVLRADGQLARQEQTDRLEALRVVVVDVGEVLYGTAVVEHLKREFPNISLEPVLLTSNVADAKATFEDQKDITKQLSDAGLIVGPWLIAVPDGNEGAVNPTIAEAVISSPARKLLAPFFVDGWDWVGVERWETEAIVNQTVRTVKQILTGEEAKLHRPMGAGSIIGIIVGVLFLLILLAIPLFRYFL